MCFSLVVPTTLFLLLLYKRLIRLNVFWKKSFFCDKKVKLKTLEMLMFNLKLTPVIDEKHTNSRLSLQMHSKYNNWPCGCDERIAIFLVFVFIIRESHVKIQVR